MRTGKKPLKQETADTVANDDDISATPKKGSTRQPPGKVWDTNKTYNLGAIIATRQNVQVGFTAWLVGDTPLIVHAWSEKAKRQMLEKQIGAAKSGKEQRDPDDDFRNALYVISEGVYGFPAMGVKNSFLSAAHKDKNIPRTSAQAGLWVDGQMTRLKPGREGAVCDMPLMRIYGDEPVMREDMVSIGAGFKKTANLAYRPQFTIWAIKVTGRTHPLLINPDKLSVLILDAGGSIGLGEWRAEKKGNFGAYHLATMEEEAAWEDFAAGTGPMPVPNWVQNESYLQAAE